MKDKQFIARTHTTCPICGKNTNEAILMHTRFGDVSQVDNKSTGFSDPCKECQADIDMGAVMIIVVDMSKSPSTKLEDLYRTGNIFGVKEEAVMRMLPEGEKRSAVLEKRVMIMDYKHAIAMALPVKYTP